MADLNKVKEIVETIGLKAEEINDEIVEKVEAYKATLDTETRRELRKVWGAISAICFVLGYFVGSWFSQQAYYSLTKKAVYLTLVVSGLF